MKLTKDNETSVSIEIRGNNQEEATIMLSSDWHYDSKCCDLELLTKHLKIAEEANAIVLVAGDMLDVMQGRHDPRRDMESLKEK